MRRLANAFRFMAVAAMIFIAATASGSAQRGTGTLEGKVIAGKRKKPVAGAAIVILKTTSTRPSPLMAPESDAKGRFRMTGLGPGVYTFQAGARGYKDARKTVRIKSNRTVYASFELK